MAIPGPLNNSVPKSFYTDGQLSVPGAGQDSEKVATEVATGIQSYVSTLPPAAATRFMAAVNAASADTFAPGGKAAGDLTSRLDKMEKALEAFSSMLTSVNDIDLLARVMIEQYGQQRREAINDRQQLRQLAQAELMNAAGQLDKQATDMMAGAIASVVMSAVSAAVSVGAGSIAIGGKINAMKAEMGATKELGGIEGELAAREEGQLGKAAGGGTKGTSGLDAPPPPTAPPPPPPKAVEAPTIGGEGAPGAGSGKSGKASDLKNASTEELINRKADLKVKIKEAEILSTKADRLKMLGETGGRLGESMGNAANSIAQSQAKSSEADAKRDEATAENLNSQADLKKALADSLDDMIKQLIGVVKDLQEAKAERMRAFTHI